MPHWCILLNRGAKCILVFSNNAEQNRYAIDILFQLEFVCYKDVIILIWDRNSDRVHVKTALPYRPPYGYCGIIRQLIDLDVWIQNANGVSFQINADLRLNKIPNKLKCCVIEDTYHDDSPPYYFFESTTDYGPTYDGVDIRLIAHINDEITDLENCEEVGRIQVTNTILNPASSLLEQKVAYPYHSVRYSYFVQRAGIYPRWT